MPLQFISPHPLPLSHSHYCSLVGSTWYLECFNNFLLFLPLLSSCLLIHLGCHCQIWVFLDCFHGIISLHNGPKLLVIIITVTLLNITMPRPVLSTFHVLLLLITPSCLGKDHDPVLQSFGICKNWDLKRRVTLKEVTWLIQKAGYKSVSDSKDLTHSQHSTLTISSMKLVLISYLNYFIYWIHFISVDKCFRLPHCLVYRLSQS